MVEQDILIPTAISVVVLLFAGHCFLSGIWHEEGKEKFDFLRRWSYVIDPDLIFGGGLNPKVVLAADIIAFWICIVDAGVVLLLGLISHFLWRNAAYAMGLFILTGLVGSWLTRAVFIFKYRKCSSEDIPLPRPRKRF
jgi:hypothetical protein